MPAEQRIQIKRRASEPSSASAWQGLLDGELGYIKNTNKLYIGNGKGVAPTLISTLSWDELTGKPTSILSQIYLNSTDPTKIVYKKVGSNIEHTLGNFTPLTNGLIDLKYLPQGALERLVVVANATARLKLTTANVQLGDTVKETDTGLMYVVVDESKLNSEDGYQVYVAGRAAAVDWTGVENKVNATSSSAGLMSAADKKKLDNTNVAYGTCTTAADVAAKVITVTGNTGWKLAAGSMISIFFSYTNTAQNPTFNVNGTGAKNVYYNQNQITTSSLSYAGYTNRICNYIYDGTQFRFHSWGYDTNTNTQIRVYRNSTSSYNKDYPLIASRTLAADLGTVGTQDSNEAVYGLISDTAANIPTINPYSGAVKVKSLSATGNISTSDGNVSGKLLHTTAATNLNAVSDKVAVIKSGGQISYRTPAQIISDAGVTATVAEINYVDGVTSNIQTQLNSKAIATDAIYFNQTGTIGSNGTFTNLIPSSTDSSGNIYNGVGYKEGIRWSKSGKAEVAAAGHHMSGFIPCKTGDTLNIKNITIGYNDPYIVLFDSSKNVINTIAAGSIAPDSQAVRSYLITISGVAFIRISAQTIDTTSIATVNEYISSGYLTGWLKQFNGAEIAPSTYISQVLDANGNPYDQHTHSYLPLKGGALTGDLFLQQNNQDRFITFEYTGNTGFDWRIGSLGTGSADENYFVIQSDKDSSNNGAFVNALRIGLTSLNALFGGNVTATKFIGPLQGNADTATKLKTARTISLTGDATGSVSFDGSANASITVTVADDSHNHTISNIDNLQSNLDLKYDKAGGPISGHIYMTGSSASSSTANTTQLIFGTSSAQHVAVTSNDKALVINPNSSATTNQIVLYLNQQSVFPGGIKISAGNLNVSGTSTLSGAVTTGATLTVGTNLTTNGTSTLKGAVTTNSTLSVGTNLTVNGTSTLKGAVTANSTLAVTGTSTLIGAVTAKSTVTLAKDPVQNLEAATKQYVDKTIENAAKLFTTTTTITTDTASSVVFDTSTVTLSTCLIYYNVLLMTPGVNYSITNNTTIALSGWTANKGDIFTVSGKQADEVSVIAAGKLNCGTVGSATLPVYFNNGIPVACDTLNYAKLESPNNLLHSTNEFTFAKAGFSGDIYINYRTDGMSTSGNIGEYKFCKGDGAGSLANIRANTFHGALSGNASTATKLATARTITLDGDVKGSASFDGSGNITITTEAGASGISYVDGSGSTTAGTWIGTNTEISGLYTGLTIAYKIGVAGASTTTLNLTTAAGASGAKTVKRNASNLTTHLPVGTVVLLTYDGTSWCWADYSTADTKNTAGTTNSTSILYLAGATSQAANPQTYSHSAIKANCNSSGANEAGSLTATKVYGAVWNDYAEYRDQVDIIEPGYCVASTDDGKVYKTIEKFQACDGIVSDTFGFSIGETDNCKTPLAVAGRVLAYCEGDRNSYHAGDTVCASLNGKVMKMTREEIKEYPDRIVGVVSEIPTYEYWGSGNVKVNNRIWIKVK